MKIPVAYSSNRGQTSIEYLLLLAVVAVIVIASFGPGALISQVHDSAQDYYNTVTRVIMGTGSNTIDNKEITPIDGGWCPVTAPSGSGPTVMYRSCECPAPAFGGKSCTDPQNPNSTACGAGQTCSNGGAMVTFPGFTPCGPCPTGQVCNSAGVCGCPNSLVCGSGNTPKGSIPSTDCAQCICILGSYYDASQNACINYCQTPCTTWNGTSCVAVTCGTNMTCDPTAKSTSVECACNQYTYWNGSACVYCQANGNNCTGVNSAGTGCVDITCPTNQYCNTQLNACQCDYFPPIFCTYWHGNACVKEDCTNPCTPTTSCPTSNGASLPNGCGTDSCGGNCGANGGGCCPSGQQQCGLTCSSSSGPGTCVSGCSACQTWNGSVCASTTPCGSAKCGTDSCGNSCGKCTSGSACSSTTPGMPGTCS